MNNKKQDLVLLHQESIKEVNKFVYLGSVVSKDGGTAEDIKRLINKARQAFNTLQPIWRSTAPSLHKKIWIFSTSIMSVLLYGSETWWLRRPTPTNCIHLLTDVSGTSSTSGGQKSSQMNNCGTGPDKPISSPRSRN